MDDPASDLLKYNIEKPGEASIAKMLTDFAANRGAFAGAKPTSTGAWIEHPAAALLGEEMALFGGAIMALENRLLKLERQTNGQS